ncbi:MAG: O-antigen ligase family protein [Deltaproteobacteria bacterium]|nr:O-antigen ligase family protein [Deltaproteobacteria bacterium]
MMKKSFLLRSYIVLLMLSLVVNVHLFSLKALSVNSVPLPLFVFLIGMAFPLCFFQDFLRFIRGRKMILILAGLFLLSGVFSVGFSPFPALHGLKCLFQYGLLFGISFLLLFLFSLEGENLGLFFLKSVAGLAVLLAFISFFEVTNEGLYRFLSDTFRGGEYQLFNGRFRAGATLTHPNIFGCFMSLGILILLFLERESGLKAGIFYPAVVILAAAMALSGSRNAVIVLLFPVLLLLLNRKTVKTTAFVIAMAVFMMVILTPSASRFADLWKQTNKTQKKDFSGEAAASREFNTVGTRLMLWQSALAMFRDYPLTGIGPGNCNRAMKDYASAALLAVEKEKIDKEYLHAHNGFLNILAEFGLIGITVALAFAIYLAVLLIRRYGFFPPLPVHALLSGIILSFIPDAFFYSLFYMVIGLTIFLLFAFPENVLCCRSSSVPSDEPAP